MEIEDPGAAVAFMQAVLSDAIEEGWLRIIPHGYCWYCQQEKQVLEVMNHKVPGEPPSQPPRCEDCFIDSGLAVMSDPVIMNSLLERSGSVEEWLQGDEPA